MCMRFLTRKQQVDRECLCPQCGSAAVHRCATKTHVERVRKRLTHRRLHLCADCRWRGWLEQAEATHSVLPTFRRELPAPDLTAIDTALSDILSHE
jgi:hypothetical protein